MIEVVRVESNYVENADPSWLCDRWRGSRGLFECFGKWFDTGFRGLMVRECGNVE